MVDYPGREAALDHTWGIWCAHAINHYVKLAWYVSPISGKTWLDTETAARAEAHRLAVLSGARWAFEARPWENFA